MFLLCVSKKMHRAKQHIRFNKNTHNSFISVTFPPQSSQSHWTGVGRPPVFSSKWQPPAPAPALWENRSLYPHWFNQSAIHLNVMRMGRQGCLVLLGSGVWCPSWKKLNERVGCIIWGPLIISWENGWLMMLIKLDRGCIADAAPIPKKKGWVERFCW